MNVTTRNTSDLSAVLTVNIKPEDYQEKVDKMLRDYRKRASIPGFRPGHVPSSLIKKQYGKAVLIEEVNHILQHAVYDHIRDEKLDILGNPLPVAQDDIDWDNQTEFSFEFELGLTPDFELSFDNKTKVPIYKIVADKKMVDRYVSDYAKRFGTMSYPEVVEENTIVKGTFRELDDKGNVVEGGLEATGTFNTDSIDQKKVMKELSGSKKGDTITLNINKTFDKETDLARVLKVDAEQLANAGDNFSMTIVEISKLEPAPLNQELFDKVFGEDAIKSEEEFRQKVKEDAEQMFVGEGERKFYEDVKETLLKKMKFDLPTEFLKKWMQTAGEKPVSAEEVEEQYPEMEDSMKWQLVENKVIKQHNIEVTEEELKQYTMNLVARQMAQYGQTPEQADLESIAGRVMENKDEVQRITDQLFSAKLTQFFRENLKLVEKEVTFDEFLKELQK
ncbi:MAG TPA: trigger factor [Cryomorphaceae bacterium]|nr:trigger factor [Owenweeksia sp.]MBF98412.1 trigger factor [Owenweeksia sp.]HAD96226.1 trigger factor [Cryomorphaceae bacterium]HCQ17539.1 trigger factor [Cryomorphaceae bacterium]|tara:strand:- start:9652 stop:10995 length:1344 start_codon:yes stop_codon:yes gene_type:complete